MTYRAIVLDAETVRQLSVAGLPEDWLENLSIPNSVVGVRRTVHNDIVCLAAATPHSDNRLLVIGGADPDFFGVITKSARLECFYRILRVSLSRFEPNMKIPMGWRSFRSDSLISFQSNSRGTGLHTRVYLDYSPEGTDSICAYRIVSDDSAALTRSGYDSDIFQSAFVSYVPVSDDDESLVIKPSGGQISVALTQNFSDDNIVQGVPFSVWRDSKLTKEQRAFFDAPFDGPLRVRGPAGTGKTLVLALRFLKETYIQLDKKIPIRAAFLAHGQETADHIRTYMTLMDERDILSTVSHPQIDIQVTTLHGIANEFINYDAEGIQPLSLDGAEGRKLQFELVQSLVHNFGTSDLYQGKIGLTREEFRTGVMAARDENPNKSFCCDLIDEFANVLEAFGLRDIDEISAKYLGNSPSPRGLAHSSIEKEVVLELYRQFRRELADLGVVSLDQFIADFLSYLNSFRWEAVRTRRGFDFVFVDELHLFNRQERRTLGYLIRDLTKKVAVAYDPRQSPRNTFFPEESIGREKIWAEAGLTTGAQQFELTDVFRYTPQILDFMRDLNHVFPGFDLSEEWDITFGVSKAADGPIPTAHVCTTRDEMARVVSNKARGIALRAKRGVRIAVLCLDYGRFDRYSKAGIFQDNFLSVTSRDDIGLIQRYAQRAVLSMPEYVAGLQFDHVIIIDANAGLVSELGGGANGLQRLVSALYLGASRAQRTLEIYADQEAGGLADPIRKAIDHNYIQLLEAVE